MNLYETIIFKLRPIQNNYYLLNTTGTLHIHKIGIFSKKTFPHSFTLHNSLFHHKSFHIPKSVLVSHVYDKNPQNFARIILHLMWLLFHFDKV